MRKFAIPLLLTVVGTTLAQQPAATPEPTARLEGRVVDLRGEPVPAADVWVVDADAEEKVLARSVPLPELTAASSR